MKRLTFVVIMLLAISGIGPVSAANTAIGPMDHICRDVTKSADNANLTLMWVAGYVSGLNLHQKRDFLEGHQIGDVVDMFRNVCLESPDKTVLEASRSVIARFRIQMLKSEDVK
jgi:hypothetical protein